MTQLPAPSATKFCQACGESINVKAEICPSCGVKHLRMEVERKGKKDRITAALLSVFRGTFGIQYFYLGTQPNTP
jgi:ribosomal protein L40E